MSFSLQEVLASVLKFLMFFFVSFLEFAIGVWGGNRALCYPCSMAFF